MDPLSQKLIKIHDCQEAVLEDTVGLPRTQLFDERGGHIGAAMNQMALGSVASIATGQFSPKPPQVPFTCSTGNCTFGQEYSSVGFCTSCIDVSDRITFDYHQNQQEDAEDPANLTITLEDASDPQQNPLHLSGFENNGAGRAWRFTLNSVQNINMLWFDASMNGTTEIPLRAHATQCLWDPCIHTFQADIFNGILAKETVQRGPNFGPLVFASNGYNTMLLVDLSCIDVTVREDLRDVGYDFNSNTRWLPYNFTVDPSLPDAESYFANMYLTDATKRGIERGFYVETFSGWTLSIAGLGTVSSKCIYQMYYTIPISLGAWYSPSYFNGSLRDTPNEYGATSSIVTTTFYAAGATDHNQNGTLEKVQNMMQNITDSMTTYVRWHGNTNMSEPALGTVLRNAGCVRVRWAYITVNASITGLLLIFSVAMIIDTRFTERKAAASVLP